MRSSALAINREQIIQTGANRLQTSMKCYMRISPSQSYCISEYFKHDQFSTVRSTKSALLLPWELVLWRPLVALVSLFPSLRIPCFKLLYTLYSADAATNRSMSPQNDTTLPAATSFVPLYSMSKPLTVAKYRQTKPFCCSYMPGKPHTVQIRPSMRECRIPPWLFEFAFQHVPYFLFVLSANEDSVYEILCLIIHTSSPSSITCAMKTRSASEWSACEIWQGPKRWLEPCNGCVKGRARPSRWLAKMSAPFASLDLDKLSLKSSKRASVVSRTAVSTFQEKRRKDALSRQEQARQERTQRARELALQTSEGPQDEVGTITKTSNFLPGSRWHRRITKKNLLARHLSALDCNDHLKKGLSTPSEKPFEQTCLLFEGYHGSVMTSGPENLCE